MHKIQKILILLFISFVCQGQTQITVKDTSEGNYDDGWMQYQSPNFYWTPTSEPYQLVVNNADNYPTINRSYLFFNTAGLGTVTACTLKVKTKTYGSCHNVNVVRLNIIAAPPGNNSTSFYSTVKSTVYGTFSVASADNWNTIPLTSLTVNTSGWTQLALVSTNDSTTTYEPSMTKFYDAESSYNPELILTVTEIAPAATVRKASHIINMHTP